MLIRLCLAGILLTSGVVRAQEKTPLEEVTDCIKGNIPKETSIQTVEFASVDRVGYEQMRRAKIYGKKGKDGFRRILTQFSKPPDIRGSAYLMFEREGANDTFIYSREQRRWRRISGRAAAGNILGTDLSYEDFERMQNLDRPDENTRLDDSEVEGRPAYVIESKPLPDAGSIYEKVVTFYDQKTCVTLKSESYEPGGRLRKLLSADPDQIQENDGIWVAHEMVMRDLRDETHTAILIESIEVDVPIKESRFSMRTPSR